MIARARAAAVTLTMQYWEIYAVSPSMGNAAIAWGLRGQSLFLLAEEEEESRE